MPSTRFLIIASCAAMLFAPTLAAQQTNVASAASKPAPESWPEMLQNNAHLSVSPDQTITASNAPTLGINWMSAIRSADLGSVVAVPNKKLGATVVYIGDERGDVIAFNEANGTTIWSQSVGAGNSERSTPLVAPDGSVWVATEGNPGVDKLDGATGKIECKLPLPLKIDSSLMLATPPGGVPTVYTAENHSSLTSGPEVAIRESNCQQLWSFNSWLILSGAWATPAFGVDANGNGRVFVGTADPDSTMYSVDAQTGAPLWNYSALNPPDGEFDIGSAATVSAPGVNGFADGVLYFPSKYGVLYALDLTTGSLIWQYNFNQAAKANGGGRSAAALYRTTLVYGMGNGVEAVNALNGQLLWHYVDPGKMEVLSSPAVAGPPGNEIVAFADAGGTFTVLSLATGSVLYTYKTGNFITSSPAIINGHILIASSDGFLYDFRLGGANVASPTTAITSPVTGSNLPNPGNTLTVTGTATGTAVTQVQVVVQQAGPTGSWYNAATSSWSPGPVNNFVSVASPGQPQSTWSFAFPVPASGSTFQVTANTVSSAGQVDRTGAHTSFAVQPQAQEPQITVSAALVPPGASVKASGGPFAAGETVSFVLQNATVGTATASSTGNVTNVPISIPVAATFGPSALLATGKTSGDSTSTQLDVSNVWVQSGYSALQTGYEPNDPVLADTLQATNKGYYSQAWVFNSGASIEAAPAVVGGSAYVANTGGTLSAVDTASGAALWTTTIPTGAAIHGAPAVGNGDVVFGADDGNVYRVAASTGASIGSVTLDGVPTSPTLVGGTIYAGTDNGTVFAISESTGNVLWSTPVGAAIQQAPSVDIVAGLLTVVDTAGHVTTMNPSTGAIVLQVSTGGAAVTAAPVVSKSTILVGASDGFLRAFNETTGKLVWKRSLGSPVLAISSTGVDVYVGAESGTAAELTLTSGAIQWENSTFASAIVGLSSVKGVVVADTSIGAVEAAKDSQFGRIVWNDATEAALSTQPAIVDGTIFAGSENGGLYTFTNHGQAPVSAIEHKLLIELRQQAGVPAAWVHRAPPRTAPLTTSAFAPHGRREFPVHLDRSEAASAASPPVVNASVATRTYVLGWAPVAIRAAAYVARARAVAGPVAGSAVDTTPYPRNLDDAAVQHEIAREIVANGWTAGANTRFLLLTAAAPVSLHPYCAYHSAFYLQGSLSNVAVYGVIPAGTMDQCGPFAAQISRESSEFSTDPFVRAR